MPTTPRVSGGLTSFPGAVGVVFRLAPTDDVPVLFAERDVIAEAGKFLLEAGILP